MLTNLALSLSEAREQHSRLFAFLMVMALLACAMLATMIPAMAQDSNPFSDANDELSQYGMYGLVAGGVILGVIVGVRAGKAIYKSLSS